jgi:hypothetical protein
VLTGALRGDGATGCGRRKPTRVAGKAARASAEPLPSVAGLSLRTVLTSALALPDRLPFLPLGRVPPGTYTVRATFVGGPIATGPECCQLVSNYGSTTVVGALVIESPA